MKKSSKDTRQHPSLSKKNKYNCSEQALQALHELQKRYYESLGITDTTLNQVHVDNEQQITSPMSPDDILSSALADPIVEEKDTRNSNVWGTIGDRPQCKTKDSDQDSLVKNQVPANKLNH